MGVEFFNSLLFKTLCLVEIVFVVLPIWIWKTFVDLWPTLFVWWLHLWCLIETCFWESVSRHFGGWNLFSLFKWVLVWRFCECRLSECWSYYSETSRLKDCLSPATKTIGVPLSPAKTICSVQTNAAHSDSIYNLFVNFSIFTIQPNQFYLNLQFTHLKYFYLLLLTKFYLLFNLLLIQFYSRMTFFNFW
jgi:hypothetical protein